MHREAANSKSHQEGHRSGEMERLGRLWRWGCPQSEERPEGRVRMGATRARLNQAFTGRYNDLSLKTALRWWAIVRRQPESSFPFLAWADRRQPFLDCPRGFLI